MTTKEEIWKQLVDLHSEIVDLRKEMMIIDDVETLCIEFLTRDIGNSTPLPEKEPVVPEEMTSCEYVNETKLN